MIAASRGSAKRLGVPAKDLIGRHCCEHVHGAPLPAQDRPFAELLAGAAESATEIRSEALGGHFRVGVTAARMRKASS